jgi:D-glycero-D-manno-heptose 1,7-bisphosphate phosphatase
MAGRVVILDRDGVINELVRRPGGGSMESPLDPAAVRLVPGVTETLLAIRSAGYLLAIVTNQPAVAKGEATLEAITAVNQTVLELLATAGVAPDAYRICLHHPDGADGSPLTGPCDCRKPAPGMLLSVVAQLAVDRATSWMVGDTDSDILAGQAAGVSTILVNARGSSHKRGISRPDWTVGDLGAASAVIISQDRPRLDWNR